MADPAGISAPNYTKIPNAILDAMADLGNAELRVILAIVRRTAGWQKECDVISLTQLENITGLARKNVVKALHDLEERKLIEHTPAKRNGKCYRLVTLSNQLPKGTSNSTLPELVTLSNQSSPQLVTLSNTQKKDSKEKKETSSAGGDEARHISYLLDQNMGAAKEFADLDPDTAIRDFDNRKKAGQSPGHIVRAWRAKRPTPDNFFGKPPTQNGTGPRQPKADALTPAQIGERLREGTL